MAAAACYYHPNQVASTACSQCGIPLCAGCVQTVANRPVCTGCVGAIRARVASQMNAAPPPAASPGMTAPPGASNPYAPPAQPYVQPQIQRPIAATGGAGGLGLLLGGVYGALIGIVGAFVLAKIEYISNFEIGYLNSLVGFGCGYGVLLGAKRGGLVPAVLGGVIAFFAMMLAEFFFFQDVVAHMATEHPGDAAMLSQVSFADYLPHIGLDWLFIAIGVYGGARTPLRAAR